MARFAIATDTYVIKSGWAERINRVAQITILIRWNMIDWFTFNRVCVCGESTVMTTFAASVYARMIESSAYKTAGNMACTTIIYRWNMSASWFVGSELAMTILTVTYNVGVNVSKES